MQYRASVFKLGDSFSPLNYEKSHILTSYYTLERRRINDIKGYYVLFPDPAEGEECEFSSITMKSIKMKTCNNDKILNRFLANTGIDLFGSHLGILLNEDFEIRGLSFDGCSRYNEGTILNRMARLKVVYDAFARVGNAGKPYELYQEWEFDNIRLTELTVFGNITNLLGFWCNTESVWNRVKNIAQKSKKPVVENVIKSLAEDLFGSHFLKLSPRKARIYDAESTDDSAFHIVNSWHKLEQLFILDFLIFLVTDFSIAGNSDLLNREYLYGITMLDLIRKHVEVSDPIISMPFEEGHWGAFKFIQQKLLNS